MKLTEPQILSALMESLNVQSGRHLYGVLGSYAQLADFEKNLLLQTIPLASTAINLNLALMEQIGDADLRNLVHSEGKRPQTVERRLNFTFDSFLAKIFEEKRFLILKQVELLFAYKLDLQTIRARATNQNHILLLLPGEKRGDHVTLFTEASSRFHRELPYQLIADNHLWEL